MGYKRMLFMLYFYTQRLEILFIRVQCHSRQNSKFSVNFSSLNSPLNEADLGFILAEA